VGLFFLNELARYLITGEGGILEEKLILRDVKVKVLSDQFFFH
jgi:hypothetical protein